MGAEVAGGGALRGHNLAAEGRPRSQKSLQVRPSLAWVTEVIKEQEESQTENGDGPGSGIPESSHGRTPVDKKGRTPDADRRAANPR